MAIKNMEIEKIYKILETLCIKNPSASIYGCTSCPYLPICAEIGYGEE